MSRPVIFVLDPYHPEAISALEALPSVECVLPPDSRKRSWQDEADGLLIRSETRLGDADFSQAKRLRVVVKQGQGIDNVDLEAARRHGVAVCNTPALNSEAVAELALGLALNVARRVGELDRRIRAGETVVRSEWLGKSLYGRTLGVVGMGNIGKVVARKWASAMEGKVIAYDPAVPGDYWDELGIQHTRARDLDELLREADVVTLHVPLTRGTRGLIGEAQLAAMKRDAILINAARGGVVDEAALLETLRAGRLWGAALDALEVEPPTVKAYGEGLLARQNVIVTPHIGGSTVDNMVRSGVAAVETVVGFLEGKEVVGLLT
ncbi:MAG: hydroxyacid dehydrogenase [Terriglobus roseus]|nr:hydroxyacid dehydrogenase [Terriglobus roseus]